MRASTIASPLALLLSLNGCGTMFSARAAVTPQGASARVTADGRAVAAAGAVAGIAAALAEGGSTDSQATVTAPVHASTNATSSGDASSGGVAAPTAGSATAVTASGSATTTATIQMGRVGGVAIERIETMGEDDNVVAGGAIVLEGAPVVDGGLVVVDGEIRVIGEAGGAGSSTATAGTRGRARVRTGVRVRAQGAGSARWRIDEGALVVADRGGHRWRLRVQGGELTVRTEGANPQGRAVWVPADGTLRVEVTAMGDGRLALHGDAPSVSVSSSAGGSATLSAPAMAALDELLAAAPAGSEEALRLAAAVQVTLREAERATPAFYNVPIRGRSIVLVVDVSYSMREPDPRAVDLSVAPGHTPTKLDVARAELVKVLGSIPADVAVNVVAFSSNVTRLWQGPRTLDRAGLSEAIRWIVGLQPRDETEPVAAIEAAASMQPEQIVLLSDGRPTDRDTVARALLGLAEGVSSRMRLDVVGIGPDQDRTFLAALAARGRGELRLR